MVYKFTYFGLPAGSASQSLKLPNNEIVRYDTDMLISDKDMQELLNEKLAISFVDLKNQGLVDWVQISVDPEPEPDPEAQKEEEPEPEPEAQKTNNNKNTNINNK